MLNFHALTVGPFETLPQEFGHTGSHYPTKLREVCTHASCKTTRTWESFNNRGTKWPLEELWLTTNNSKNFPRKKNKLCRLAEKACLKITEFINFINFNFINLWQIFCKGFQLMIRKLENLSPHLSFLL